MKYYRLVSDTDHNTGELGFYIKGLKINPDLFMISSDSLQIAHDIIEHVNGVSNIGTIHDELQALGSVWYVRGQFGDLSRDGRGSAYSPQENIASDITRMITEDYTAGIEFKRLNKSTRPCDDDGVIREIANIGIKKAIEELKWNDYYSQVKNDLHWIRKDVLNYMRIGYRKAVKRYRKYGGAETANTLFWRIKETLLHHMHHVDYEGQQLRLSIDYNKQRVYVDEIYEDYSY